MFPDTIMAHGRDLMAVNRKRFVTRSEYAEQNKRVEKINHFSKYLNILIVLASILIVLTLVITIATTGDNEVVKEEPAEKPPVEQQQQPTPNEVEQVATSDSPEEKIDETIVVTENEDAVVKEVHTNEAWPVYPTQQTGPHTSTYQKGHIDYKEKLAAIFSVVDLKLEESIVLNVGNNGSASSAIAVVTSMDRTQMYRVSIEWVEGQGWKPVKLEVLNTVEGAY